MTQFILYSKICPNYNICDFEKVSDFVVNNNIKTLIDWASCRTLDRAEEDSETVTGVNIKGI